MRVHRAKKIRERERDTSQICLWKTKRFLSDDAAPMLCFHKFGFRFVIEEMIWTNNYFVPHSFMWVLTNPFVSFSLSPAIYLSILQNSLNINMFQFDCSVVVVVFFEFNKWAKRNSIVVHFLYPHSIIPMSCIACLTIKNLHILRYYYMTVIYRGEMNEYITVCFILLLSFIQTTCVSRTVFVIESISSLNTLFLIRETHNYTALPANRSIMIIF